MLAIVVGILLLSGINTGTAEAPTIEQYPELIMIDGSSVQGSLIPVWVESRSYAIPSNKTTNLGEIDPLLFCLIQKESGGNELAYNPKDIDGFPKYGLLQFHKPTFQEWCVDKYKLPNDIWDGNVQIKCFNKMKQDGQMYRWPPAIKFCLDM